MGASTGGLAAVLEADILADCRSVILGTYGFSLMCVAECDAIKAVLTLIGYMKAGATRESR